MISNKVTTRGVPNAPHDWISCSSTSSYQLDPAATFDTCVDQDIACVHTIVTDDWKEFGCTPAGPVMVAVAMTRYRQKRYITRGEGSSENSSISGRVCSRWCAWWTRFVNQELQIKLPRLSSANPLFHDPRPRALVLPVSSAPTDGG